MDWLGGSVCFELYISVFGTADIDNVWVLSSLSVRKVEVEEGKIEERSKKNSERVDKSSGSKWYSSEEAVELDGITLDDTGTDTLDDVIDEEVLIWVVWLVERDGVCTCDDVEADVVLDDIKLPVFEDACELDVCVGWALVGEIVLDDVVGTWALVDDVIPIEDDVETIVELDDIICELVCDWLLTLDGAVDAAADDVLDWTFCWVDELVGAIVDDDIGVVTITDVATDDVIGAADDEGVTTVLVIEPLASCEDWAETVTGSSNDKMIAGNKHELIDFILVPENPFKLAMVSDRKSKRISQAQYSVFWWKIYIFFTKQLLNISQVTGDV